MKDGGRGRWSELKMVLDDSIPVGYQIHRDAFPVGVGFECVCIGNQKNRWWAFSEADSASETLHALKIWLWCDLTGSLVRAEQEVWNLQMFQDGKGQRVISRDSHILSTFLFLEKFQGFFIVLTCIPRKV